MVAGGAGQRVQAAVDEESLDGNGPGGVVGEQVGRAAEGNPSVASGTRSWLTKNKSGRT